MKLYPAIDIKNGQCVRLQQGLFDATTVYSNAPFEVAKQFEEVGAKFLHIVCRILSSISGVYALDDP